MQKLRVLLIGLGLTALGAGLNFTALTVNGGLFPEHAPGSHPGYIDAAQARLPWLGDWLPLWGRWWLSPGDLFAFAGLALTAWAWFSLVLHGLRTGRWHLPVREALAPSPDKNPGR